MKSSAQVALIQMPFAVTNHPSLGLSLLKGQLESREIHTEVLYFNMLFSRIFGFEKYHCISQGGVNMTDLIGEWIFRFGNDDDDSVAKYEELYFIKHRKLNQQDNLTRVLNIAKEMRSSYKAFITECFEFHDWSRFKVVGFTTMFEQTNACLQLAKRIKESFPSIKIVFGGANCDGTMGKTLLNCYDFIDAVCVGEGDISFPQYVVSTISGQECEISGIVVRGCASKRNGPGKAAEIVKLDELPFPVYDDFFEYYERYCGPDTKPPRIMFETSRGCWWGQKNHCTFCGLNGTTMEFRQKTAKRALTEISHIVAKHGDKSKRFFATDNIMPVSYFKDFLPKLKEANLELEFFYETKANLRKDQLRLYKEAGLDAIQPGIESLDTSILKLMKKGTSSLQNVQLLKWCKEFDIVPHWNYLVGFPGEDPSCYDRQAKLVRSLFHLSSPGPMAMVRFDRFSPYLISPKSYQIESLNPYPSYAFAFKDIPKELLPDYAYYFEAEFPNKENVDAYTINLSLALDEWVARGDTVALTHFENDGTIIIFDCRHESVDCVFQLDRLSSIIFKTCDEASSVQTIQQSVSKEFDGDHSDRIQSVLNQMCENGLMITESGRYLSISVSLDSLYKPSSETRARLANLIGADNIITCRNLVEITAEESLYATT